MTRLQSTDAKRERAIVVGVDRPGLDWPLDDSLAELERLAQTDGAEVVGREIQRLTRIVPKTHIGSGKAQEIADRAKAQNVDVVIFDDELSPSQQANLERVMGEGIKVIDRTALILDIFGKHATTKEGKLQVQLAQNQYVLPRLRGMWSHLVSEQTRGGIGSRFGQGESQLEVDRRLIRKRISSLKSELGRLERRRQIQSKARWDSGIFRVALVGYTNAGKSTLLNTLTGANAYVRDELFATLDPTTRTFALEEGREVTLTDTVGFVQKLPTMLVEAFKSTLAEVLAADLLLLVADAHDPNVQKQIASVVDVLAEIGASEIRSVVVYNKCDLLEEKNFDSLRSNNPDALYISALSGKGVTGLAYRISKEASRDEETLTVRIPYGKGSLVGSIHERCRVMHEQYEHDGLVATVKASGRMKALLAPYAIEEQ